MEKCFYSGIYCKKLNYEFKIIKYGDSSFYDNKRVVGYLSAVFYKPEKIKISEDERNNLLSLTYKNMKGYFKGKQFKYKGKLSEEIKEKRGVFITLYKNGKLRACVGSLNSDYPLYKFIPMVARAVLKNDKRFKPIGEKEVDSLRIEISIIYDLKRVYSVKKFKIGENGLFLIKGVHRGVLLPKVAIEQRWNKHEFLINLCKKGNLKNNCFKDKNVYIYKFRAFVFSKNF